MFPYVPICSHMFPMEQPVPIPTTPQVGRFISHLCNSSESSLQMLVACGGLEAIVELISSEYFHNPDLAPGPARGGFKDEWILSH